MGHGTMVTSVAATSNGVAPGAMVGAYRVFGCSGYAGDNVLVDAIDRAVRDGCDVINLSLATGSGFADTVSLRGGRGRRPCVRRTPALAGRCARAGAVMRTQASQSRMRMAAWADASRVRLHA